MDISLNKEQEIVKKTDGSMLVVAGAGTGKTRVLVEKVIHLLDRGVEASEILVLTFTNKAGDEMRERILSRKHHTKIPFIGTFHSFCAKLLREFGEVVGIEKNFVILDADASRRIVKSCMKQIGIDDITPKVIQKAISVVKINEALTGEKNIYTVVNEEVQQVVEQVFPLYKKNVRDEGAVDFDDLLIYATNLLEQRESIRNIVSSMYSHILIDEFQDTDSLQNKLIHLLKNEKTSVIAVGDTDQTIYSWRGADVHNLLTFEQQHKGAKTFLLTKNYRSSKTILDAANAVIEKNILRQKKELRSTRETGKCIEFMCSYDEEEEAEAVAEKILEVHKMGVPYREIAVLFRVNFQSRALEMQLLKHSIPYIVLGTKFFNRREIKGITSYLTLTQKPNSRSAYEYAVGIPQRGIGKKTLEKVFSGNKESLSPTMLKRITDFEDEIKSITKYSQQHTIDETIKHIVKLLDYRNYIEKNFDNPDERMLNINELIQFAKKFSYSQELGGIEQFLSEISLGSDQDTLRVANKQDSVKLMTIHSAKGLEFSCVFITGMEEGLFPLSREKDGVVLDDAEEERRLCYVAITRAKDLLHCSFAQRRGIFGTYKAMQPSSFLKDIPKHLLSKNNNLYDNMTSITNRKKGKDIQW